MYAGTYNRLHVHVSATDREVIKAARKKLKHHALHDIDYRDSRHELYRAMLKYHHDHQKLVQHFKL